MFIIAVSLWVYFIIGLVWTAYTAYKIGNFFEGENLPDKLDRIAAFLISVVIWPCTLLIPWYEGFIEARNKRNKSET